MMSNEGKKIPLRRNFISLELKIHILDRLKKGEKVSNVAKSLNLNEATIRTIKKNEHKIRTAVSAGSSIFANMTARPRAPIIEKMEKLLSIWIDESTKQQTPLDGNVIKQKALKIYDYLKKNGESAVDPEFVASKGWFERFKKRFVLRTIRIQGESGSVDNDVVRNPEELHKFISEHGLLSHQVFNVDEADLWWKNLSNRTPSSKNDKIAANINTKIEADDFEDATATDLTGQEADLLEEKEEDKANVMKMTMEVDQSDSEEDKSVNGSSEISNFTLTSIRNGLNLAEELTSYFLNIDPSIERSTKFKRELEQCLAPYRELYKNLESESSQILSTNDFIKKEENVSSLNTLEESLIDEDT